MYFNNMSRLPSTNTTARKTGFTDIYLAFLVRPTSIELALALTPDWQMATRLRRYQGLDAAVDPSPRKRPRSSTPFVVADADAKQSVVVDARDANGGGDGNDDCDNANNADDDDDGDEYEGEAPHWSVESPPARLRRAETILLQRTSRITIVVDRAIDFHNICAVFRTADALGLFSILVFCVSVVG
jgi:hypothetical protein